MVRHPFPTTSLPLRALVCLSVALAVGFSATALRGQRAHAAPSVQETAEGLELRSRSTTPSLSLSKSSASIAPTGTISVTVGGSLPKAVRRLEVRLRIRRPSGRLVYQKTVTRRRLKAGSVAVEFEKSFAGLSLREGRYAIEAQVTADSLPTVTLTDRLYLVKPGRRPIPVVVVPRFDYAPSIDPDGRFVFDPALSTQPRDQVVALTGMLSRMPSLRLTLAMPPLLIDEWRRVMAGYQTVGPEGVRSVAKNAPVTATYSSALGGLRSAADSGRLEVLDVPFADPDLAGLASIDALSDVAEHFARSSSLYQASLGTTPVAGTAVLGDAVSPAAAKLISAEKISFVLLRPDAVATSKGTTAGPGVYALRGTRLKGAVIDAKAASMLERSETTPEKLLDHLFARLTSSESTQPLVVPVRLGPGSTTDVAALETMLRELTRTGWVRFEGASAVASAQPMETRRTASDTSGSGRPAPSGYWAEVAEARKAARAFVTAVSERDPDAEAAMYAALVAQSRSWAGPDDRWSLADRGRAFASSAKRRSDDVLGKVSISSSNITLSGSSGRVPLSVKNESGKTLRVTVVAGGGPRTAFPSGSSVKATLRPSDNYVTIPVDLGSGGIYDRLTVAVVSGDVRLASTTLDVRASYLDRVALVATVVALLAGLLFYIRRNVRRAEADT